MMGEKERSQFEEPGEEFLDGYRRGTKELETLLFDTSLISK